jgi:oxygen-independent coproporphyrinogen-3 oxidase
MLMALNASPSRDPLPHDVHSALPHDVLKRFAGRGPRYTSYPPATAWSESVTADDLCTSLDAARAKQPTERPMSLYVHLPFCPSMCWFCACNVLITPRTDLADRYLDAVECELELLAPHLAGAKAVQLHLGGGSPTWCTPAQLRRLHAMVARVVPLDPRIEAAIEVDPRVTTTEHLETLRDLGFNRLSLGVQDFDAEVQLAVNRIQSLELTVAFVQRCRELGFQSINLDLIYGLPRQSPASFAKTLGQVCEIRPGRLALYGYAHVPWMKPFQKKIPEQTVPDADARFTLFKGALDVFLDEGYDYIGMDHFALPDDELAVARKAGTLHRNFMGYSTQKGTDLLALGLSSISFVQGVYAQNEKKLNRYYEAVEKRGVLPVERGWRMTADDHLRADVVQRLMCKGEIDTAAVERDHAVQFHGYFARELLALDEHEREGLLHWSDGGKVLRLTLLGRVLVRAVAVVFDAYLGKAPPAGQGAPRFSAI